MHRPEGPVMHRPEGPAAEDVGSDEDAQPWDNIKTTAFGKFVLDRKNLSVGAHCPYHKDCRANKADARETGWGDISFVILEAH